jgi:site-specific recombinase XerD
MEVKSMHERLNDLSALIDAARNNLTNHKYSSSTIRQFSIIWTRLSSFLGDKQIDLYEPIHGLDFLHSEINYPDVLQQPLTVQQKYMIRAIRLLNDYQKTGTISDRLCIRRINWDSELKVLHEELLEFFRSSHFSKSTIKTRMFAADRFLKIVVLDRGVNLNDLNAEIISEYIAGLTEYCKESVAVVLAGLRALFRFLYIREYTDADLSEYVPRLHGAYAERVPHVISAENVRKLLDSIDRGSPLGKRDYAIIVMAAMLGLRDSDITDLTFDNLDWEKNRIELFQRKTKKTLCLPLIPAVGEAIIDYMRYGRPRTDSPYVFVTHRAPFKKATSFYSIMKQRLYSAEIRLDSNVNHGLHILRHTLASELIRQGEAYTTISAILGHSSIGSTDTYSHVDIDGLLKCALELREVTTHE